MGNSLTVKSPGTFKAGKELSGTSSHYDRLLFMPVDETNNPCLLIQKAVPNIIESAKLNFVHANRLFFPIVFHAIRKTSDIDGMYYIGNKTGAVLR